MFESLQERLGSILNGLTGRGALSEADVAAALREIRRALLEADVALEVVRGFTDKVREKAVGAAVLRSIKPGQMVVKIVHDELVEMLGAEGETIDLNAPAPVVVMMVGLQGSGKTTTSAKIAKRLSERQGKKVLMASLDTRRPAAQEQLRQLGEQTNVPTLPIIAGQILYYFESNVRSATIIGIVGAGGIGLQLSEQIRTYDFDQVAFVVIMILVTVAAIDWISGKLRFAIIGRRAVESSLQPG